MKKSMIKATETMEEKRVRRMNKKEVKDRKRKEQMGWDEEMMVRLKSNVNSRLS